LFSLLLQGLDGRNGSIGAYDEAGTASGAGSLGSLVSEFGRMVALGIEMVPSQKQAAQGATHYTELATFTFGLRYRYQIPGNRFVGLRFGGGGLCHFVTLMILIVSMDTGRNADP